jgi:hypothetical protein
MRDLFEKLVSGGEEAVNELVAQGYQENVELEFKTKSNPSDGELTKEDRKNLGIALSALSNSMGGVLLWGISAAKNGDGVDCASGLRPISEIDKFKSEVERAVSQALRHLWEAKTSPPVRSRQAFLESVTEDPDASRIAAMQFRVVIAGLAVVTRGCVAV